ncbi:MAG: hypothetical protein LUC93_02555 [Planctomycetaceae bacterium]|nr:hypothetical protein [Planctomycetaceae bacterium]
MLSQEDFIGMLNDMQSHVEKTIKITDELVAELDDKDLRFKLIALRQTKYVHLETMNALSTLIKKNMRQSGVVPASITSS